MLTENIKNKLLQIIELSNGSIIIVGSISAYLNGIVTGKGIGDIDILTNDIKNLEGLGEIVKFRNNKMIGIEIDRYYIKSDEILIDIFVHPNINGGIKTSIVDGIEIKHQTLEKQIKVLEKILENVKEYKKDSFLPIFEKKLELFNQYITNEYIYNK